MTTKTEEKKQELERNAKFDPNDYSCEILLEKTTMASVGRSAYFETTSSISPLTCCCNAIPMSICFPEIW